MAYSYSRRNEVARSKGFSGYSEYRRATEFANTSKDFQRHIGSAGGRKAENLDMAKLYYQAFGPKADPNDYSVQLAKSKPVVRKGKGAKAKWLIDVAGYVGDTDEWRRRYPRGVRE